MKDGNELLVYHYQSTVNRFALSFEDYQSTYRNTLSEYDAKFGIKEFRFTEIEIDSIEELLRYKLFFDQTITVPRSKEIDDVENKYKSALVPIIVSFVNNGFKIGNWNRSKIEFLRSRQSDIESHHYVIRALDYDSEEEIKLSFAPIKFWDEMVLTSVSEYLNDLLKNRRIDTTQKNIEKFLSVVFQYDGEFNKSFTRRTCPEPIKLLETYNINELSKFFGVLLESQKISTKKENLKRILIALFEKDGSPLKKATLDTYLTSGKEHTRSKK